LTRVKPRAAQRGRSACVFAGHRRPRHVEDDSIASDCNGRIKRRCRSVSARECDVLFL